MYFRGSHANDEPYNHEMNTLSFTKELKIRVRVESRETQLTLGYIPWLMDSYALLGCLIKRLPQVLVEPLERACPRKFGGCFVITRRRVVVKAVLFSVVHV